MTTHSVYPVYFLISGNDMRISTIGRDRTTAVQWQLWLCERATLLHYTYITVLHYKYITCLFYDSLTVHLSISLANDQFDVQILNTFITILYMFRAISCSSSGGQIVLTLRLLMSYIYIYMEHLFLMFLDHTQRRSTVGRTPLAE